MKKFLITVLVALAMLAMFVGTVSAAPMASGVATLVSVEYLSSGPVFTFSVNGEFSKADLKGSLHIENGNDLDLYCTQIDASTVKCFPSKEVGGKKVTIFWGGETFWATVPAAPPSNYCYSIWDWKDFTNNEWANLGTHCQNNPANEHDRVTYTVPDPSGSYDESVQFYKEDVSGYCPSPVPYDGPAYYHPYCPGF